MFITNQKLIVLTVFATLGWPICAVAYDGWGESNPDLGRSGLAARFLWQDLIEDGNIEDLHRYPHDLTHDHLASLQANMNFAAWRTSYASGDFDSNGCEDLAIGMPYATVAGEEAAGRVVVYYFDRKPVDSGTLCLSPPCSRCSWQQRLESYSGQEPANRRVLRSSPRGHPSLDSGDFVGFSLAAGDFNCDGIDDLALGAPGRDFGDHHSRSPKNAGAVWVGYGVDGVGLDFATEPQTGTDLGMLSQKHNTDRFRLPGALESWDLTGFSLAAGNFYGGPSCTDLAIGVPGETLGHRDDGKVAGGVVIIVAGDLDGLDAAYYRHSFSENVYSIQGGKAAQGHLFGFALAAAPFTTPDTVDGYDDLAIGTPGYSRDAGRVYILRGSASGPFRPSGNQACLDQYGEQCLNLAGGREQGDRLGFALATGDFNGDHYADLAIGVPGEQLGSCCTGEGLVSLAKGYNNGLAPLSSNLYSGNSRPNAALPGDQRSGDALGFSLAAADFDNDGYDDLAIGAPGEGIRSQKDAGAVFIAFGACRADGATSQCHKGSEVGLLATDRTVMLHQSSSDRRSDLIGAAESGDLVGVSVHGADLNGDGRAEIIAAAPGERTPGAAVREFLPEEQQRFLQTYWDGYTHIVAGAFGGADATLENVWRRPRKEGTEGTLATILLPKHGNDLLPGLLDLVRENLAELEKQVPSGVVFGEPNFSVVDSIVPHPFGTNWGVRISRYSNVLRMDLPIRRDGVIDIDGRIFAKLELDCDNGHLVLTGEWEAGDFSWFEDILLDIFAQDAELSGYVLERIDLEELIPQIPAARCKDVQILPTMDVEVTF